MMRAWTKIVACGTALWVDSVVRKRGRPLVDGEVEDLVAGACAYARGVSGADYLEAVGAIHAYGREMAAFFAGHDVLLTATLAEPPGLIGRFAHSHGDYLDYRMGEGMVFADVKEVQRAYDNQQVELNTKIEVRLAEYQKDPESEDGFKKIIRRQLTTVGRALLSEILPKGLPFEQMNATWRGFSSAAG